MHVPSTTYLPTLLTLLPRQQLTATPETGLKREKERQKKTKKTKKEKKRKKEIDTKKTAMAVPRKSLSGFLTQAKGALRAAMDTKQNITLVIGNESAGEE